MDLSIIIVEYHCADLLRKVIDSLHAFLSSVKYEIIIVSNSVYPDEKQRRLAADLHEAMMIFKDVNSGFGKANNQAIRRSLGKYLLLINPDAQLTDSGVGEVMRLMDASPQIAIVGPKIIDKDGVIQDSCRRFMSVRRLFERNVQRILNRADGSVADYSGHATRRPVDWLSGACMLVKRDAINQVGLMDERFFMYIEDMDWCRRFWEAGWQVWYDPFWQVEHNASRSSTSAFRLANRLMWIHLQSYVKYFLKWSGKPIKGDVGP